MKQTIFMSHIVVISFVALVVIGFFIKSTTVEGKKLNINEKAFDNSQTLIVLKH